MDIPSHKELFQYHYHGCIGVYNMGYVYTSSMSWHLASSQSPIENMHKFMQGTHTWKEICTT